MGPNYQYVAAKAQSCFSPERTSGSASLQPALPQFLRPTPSVTSVLLELPSETVSRYARHLTSHSDKGILHKGSPKQALASTCGQREPNFRPDSS